MKIERVTITGADDKTNVDDIIKISEQYPFVEWGLLFSPSRINTPRYPSMSWVWDIEEKISDLYSASGKDIKFSAHLCGFFTKEYITTGDLTYANRFLGDLISNGFFGRYQLNFNSTKNIVCNKFYEILSNTKIKQIIQHNQANHDLCQNIIKEYDNENIHFLYDGSGGRGVLPKQWQGVVPKHFTGYAGGLNPDNLSEALEKINEAVGDNTIWIDVETGVRTNDDLDLDKVVKFLEIASKYK